MTSSLLRSLRRGEVYKYAIVFYDKYGRRTDVMPIGEHQVKSYNEIPPFTSTDYNLFAYPIGVNIKIPQIKNKDGEIVKDIIGCQIVRRSSSDVYQETLLQVALARPIQQGLLDINVDDWEKLSGDAIKKSPFYPTGFLSVNDIRITPTFYLTTFIPFDDIEDLVYRVSIFENQSLVDALDSLTRNRQLY